MPVHPLCDLFRQLRIINSMNDQHSVMQWQSTFNGKV